MSDDFKSQCHEAILASCTQLSGHAVAKLKPGEFQWVRSDDAAAACARAIRRAAMDPRAVEGMVSEEWLDQCTDRRARYQLALDAMRKRP